VGFIAYGLINILVVWKLYQAVAYQINTLVYLAFGIFVLAWIGQFIGHKIEGAKPSFLKDIQFLLIGPAWLMNHVFQRFGISL
jgi:uncharacterized membrane protein YGL010W